MSDDRPNPDALLSRLAVESARDGRGRLKVFFGANPGVGKTYAMLEAAQILHRQGEQILVGIVETHGRKETEALLEGLAVLPRRAVQHRDMRLMEFDLDAALAMRPRLILVDELAHTNAPGGRHEKRWQDVTELIDAGIDVYTTLNVQHLESLNDIVEQITGVRVRETVPDLVLERADEIVLIDLPPQELLERLKAGKVYAGAQAIRAADGFFKPGNLLALRELALRFVAKRVNVAVQVYRDAEAARRTWATQERLLVAVGPSPTSAKLVRATKRLASTIGADWIAVSVSTPHTHATPVARERIAEHLRLAQSLGAEVVAISGADVPGAILNYARDRNVTKIIAGKPVQPRWRELLRPSPVDRLIRESGDIDVYVIRGEGDGAAVRVGGSVGTQSAKPYMAALACVAGSSAVAWVMYPFFALSDLAMVYLVGITAAALVGSRGATILAATGGVLAFNVLFVPPRFSLSVESTHYFLTFAVMFIVAVVISSLTLRLRQQVTLARESEQRTVILHRLSRRLSALRGVEAIIDATLEEIATAFQTEAVAFLPDPDGRARFAAAHPVAIPPSVKETGVAQWVTDNGRPAGPGTGTLESSILTHLPIRVADAPPLAVLAVKPPVGLNGFSADQLELISSLCGQAALALEVDRLEQRRRMAETEVESERLRSSILSTVSHDLRTPIASIQGCAESLLGNDAAFTKQTRDELLRTISEEAQRVSSMIANLLDMTRLEGGALELNRVAIPVDELVGSALTAMDSRLTGRAVRADIPPELPFVFVDEILMQHVLLNLLENAIKYSPSASAIEVIARRAGIGIELEIRDHGPGLAPGEEHLIFEKFHRGRAGRDVGGVGLGLAICRAIVHAHGGTVSARNHPEGGASFLIALPAQAAPTLPEEKET